MKRCRVISKVVLLLGAVIHSAHGAVAWGCLAPLGVQADPAPDRDAKQVLQTAAEALKEVRTVSFEAEFALTGDQELRYAVRGKVALASLPDDEFLGGKASVTGEASIGGEVTTFRLTYDGNVVRRFNSRDKKLREGHPQRRGRILFSGDGDVLVLRAFLSDKPLNRELQANDQVYEGERDVGGVVCDIVRLSYADRRRLQARWFFGREDHLPRKVEYRHRSVHPARTTVLTISLADLETNIELDEAVFANDRLASF